MICLTFWFDPSILDRFGPHVPSILNSVNMLRTFSFGFDSHRPLQLSKLMATGALWRAASLARLAAVATEAEAQGCTDFRHS